MILMNRVEQQPENRWEIVGMGTIIGSIVLGAISILSMGDPKLFPAPQTMLSANVMSFVVGIFEYWLGPKIDPAPIERWISGDN